MDSNGRPLCYVNAKVDVFTVPLTYLFQYQSYKLCLFCCRHCNVTSCQLHGISNYWQLDHFFVRLFRLTSTKIKAFNHCPFVRGIQEWSVDSPHPGQVMQKSFYAMTSPCNRWALNSSDSHYTRPIIQSMLKCSQLQRNLGAFLTICLHGYTCAANDIKASLAFQI